MTFPFHIPEVIPLKNSNEYYGSAIVTTRPFSLPCYLQGSENGRVVTIDGSVNSHGLWACANILTPKTGTGQIRNTIALFWYS
jgi:hypothetical protein